MPKDKINLDLKSQTSTHLFFLKNPCITLVQIFFWIHIFRKILPKSPNRNIKILKNETTYPSIKFWTMASSSRFDVRRFKKCSYLYNSTPYSSRWKWQILVNLTEKNFQLRKRKLQIFFKNNFWIGFTKKLVQNFNFRRKRKWK